MKTLVLEAPGRFRLRETPAPQKPGPGEALVRVLHVGVCGTDLHAFKGDQPFFTYPRVLGHELAVEVVEADPSETEIAPGTLCAVEPYLHCGTCIACRRGKTNCCTRLEVLGVHRDGGMCEYLVVPASKLHPAVGLPPEHVAVFEMLAIGAHAARRADVEPGEWALVIGAGPIGLAVAMFARKAGARLIIMERSRTRLDSARKLGLFDHVVDAGTVTEAELCALAEGDLPTLVLDATGSSASMNGALRFVAGGGRLVLVGLFQGDLTFSDPEFHRREATLLSSRNATAADFAQVIAAARDGSVPVGPLISVRTSLAAAAELFPVWLSPEAGVVKAVLHP